MNVNQKILIVDDVYFNLEALKILLKIEGISNDDELSPENQIIDTCLSGEQALTLFKNQW